MRKCFKLASIAAVVASVGLSTLFADDKPKTASEEIAGTPAKFDLVQLPAGKITLKDGKDSTGTPVTTWEVKR